MEYSKERIRGDVRAVLEENIREEGFLEIGDLETLSLDEIIESKIEDAVTLVHNSAPAELLGEGKALTGQVELKDGWGEMILPEDFLRMVSFRLEPWRSTVFEALTPEDPRYRRQKFRWKGPRGRVEPPAVAIVPSPKGRKLEIFPMEKGEEIAEAAYWPRMSFKDGDRIEISELLYRPTVYAAGALTREAYGDYTGAKALMERSAALMNASAGGR